MILLAYASKSGTAREAAERLAALLSSVELVDLSKEAPDLDAYDAVIIGSGIRMGALHKAAASFIEKNRDRLRDRKLAIYVTNSFSDSAMEFLEKAVPEDLRGHALWIGSVGGRLDMDSLKGFDKFVAKMVSRAVEEGQKVNDGIDDAALREIAARFQ